MLRIDKAKHIHQFSPDNDPAAYAESGEPMVFEAMDGLEGKTLTNNGIPDFPPLTERNTNPATGPVFIYGAQPGNVLEVDIHDIRMTTAGYFHLHEDMLTWDGSGGYEYVQLETRAGEILFENMALPAMPMIGVIGTAPPENMWCQENGNYGGNMDARIIGKGATILLPVYVEGGLLALGDLHAAQGDGEVFGQGLEIGAEVELTATVRKDIRIQWPIVLGPKSIACIVSGTDIKAASMTAVKEMGQFLVSVKGLSFRQAGILIALYGNLTLCQIVNPMPTVRMEISREFIRLFNAV